MASHPLPQTRLHALFFKIKLQLIPASPIALCTCFVEPPRPTRRAGKRVSLRRAVAARTGAAAGRARAEVRQGAWPERGPEGAASLWTSLGNLKVPGLGAHLCSPSRLPFHSTVVSSDPQASLRQAPKSLAAELPFDLGHGQVKTVQPCEENTSRRLWGSSPRLGKAIWECFLVEMARRISSWRRGDREALNHSTEPVGELECEQEVVR